MRSNPPGEGSEIYTEARPPAGSKPAGRPAGTLPASPPQMTGCHPKHSKINETVSLVNETNQNLTCIHLKHHSDLQAVPEGEGQGAGGLVDWVVSRDSRAEKNHVDQSQKLLPVLHLFQENP